MIKLFASAQNNWQKYLKIQKYFFAKKKLALIDIIIFNSTSKNLLSILNANFKRFSIIKNRKTVSSKLYAKTKWKSRSLCMQMKPFQTFLEFSISLCKYLLENLSENWRTAYTHTDHANAFIFTSELARFPFFFFALDPFLLANVRI